MEDAVANAEDIRFDIELALEQQLGAQPLPFPGMDSKCVFSRKEYRETRHCDTHTSRAVLHSHRHSLRRAYRFPLYPSRIHCVCA